MGEDEVGGGCWVCFGFWYVIMYYVRFGKMFPRGC